MRSKRLITVVLLVFVGASVAWLVAKEWWPRGEVPAAAPVVPLEGRHVVVYYFLTNVRCPTCHKLEAYTEETVRTGFADAVKEGLLLWRPLNTDEPRYAHYTEDYRLVAKAVVVAEFRDGKEIRWKNLDRIWDLVGDKEAFQAYVTEEVAAYVKDKG